MGGDIAPDLPGKPVVLAWDDDHAGNVSAVEGFAKLGQHNRLELSTRFLPFCHPEGHDRKASAVSSTTSGSQLESSRAGRFLVNNSKRSSCVPRTLGFHSGAGTTNPALRRCVGGLFSLRKQRDNYPEGYSEVWKLREEFSGAARQ